MKGARIHELWAGRRVLAGSTLGSAVGVHSLPFYTSGLFLVALQAEFGWSRSSISLGTSLLAIGLGVAAPIVGYLADRYGEKRLIVPGLIIQIAALLALSTINNLLSFYLLMGGMAFLGAGCATLPYLRLVNRNFHLGKGTALGLMITGAAAISALAPSLLQTVIDTQGWRTGYVTLAIVAAVTMPVVVWLLWHGGTSVTIADAEARSEPFQYRVLMSDRRMHIMVGSVFLVAIACPGLITHMAALLSDAGAGPAEAAAMIGVIGVSQTAARLGTGLLVDRFFAPHVAACLLATAALGFLIFTLGGPDFAIIGAIAAGLAYGAESDLLGYLIGRYYPREHFGRIFGINYTIFLCGTAASPLIYGIFADQTGSYMTATALACGSLAASAALFMTLPRFPETER